MTSAEIIHDAGDAPYRKCPVDTRAQALIFDRDFFTPGSAVAWARANGFHADEVDVKVGTVCLRQEALGNFVDGSFKIMRLQRGVKVRYGCPKPSAADAPAAAAEDHVHGVVGVTTGAIPVPEKEGGCAGGCAVPVPMGKSPAYEACLAEAAKLGSLKTTKSIYDLLAPVCGQSDQELFIVVPLDARFQLRCAPIEIHRGARAHVEVSTADVLRAVIVSGASNFVVVHNHPSGRCSPSRADKQLTKHIERATKQTFLGSVCFLDHIVIGRGEYWSERAGKAYKGHASSVAGTGTGSEEAEEVDDSVERCYRF